ncbi:MAG: preprotein translocase subunit SecG [Porphyromonas sp.]|uniref:preprotein translocase subunit SecG n=1 Tax=Porphyromonas sp. TaxID=1924944 RepID=UPI002A749283|nr:preprotein translocase subunit SecG [Porphyromonas sp.]MDY3111533.1 preprotein translocase subunit SecG [Porphyromonas sp.]MDY4246064.1 preprotein translocase subunit SecG [Porphyromonas sp.]
MQIFLSILILIVAILLILIVIVQNSKGGGLAAGFGESNKYMGVRKTTDFLEKATWTLAGALVVLSIASSFFVKPQVQAKQSESFIEQSQQSAPLLPQQPEATLPLPAAPAPEAQPEAQQPAE